MLVSEFETNFPGFRKTLFIHKVLDNLIAIMNIVFVKHFICYIFQTNDIKKTYFWKSINYSATHP